MPALRHIRQLEPLAQRAKIDWDAVWPCRPARLLDDEKKSSVKMDKDSDKKHVIDQLEHFLIQEIVRLSQLQSYLKGRDGKSELYLNLLNCLNASHELKSDNIRNIIKECALIAHHKRYSKWDRLASTCSLGFFRSESTSWIQWKQLCTRIDEVTDQAFKKLFNDTLVGKEGRRITRGDSDIDGYNRYRAAKLASLR